MATPRNTIVTPLIQQSYKLHKLFLGHLYPYPLTFKFSNEQVSIQVQNVFRLKYVPFLLSLIFITGITGFGSCVFLSVLKLFHPSLQFHVMALVFCVFLGSCAFLELGTCALYAKATEIEPLLNQLFALERNYYRSEIKNSKDLAGGLMMFINLIMVVVGLIFLVVAILLKLDPFFYMFEIVLQSSYQRSFELRIALVVIRAFLGYMCIFEFTRFITLLLFIFIFFTFTILTCLRQLISPVKTSERTLLKLYTQLRIVLKISDYFTRNVLVLLLTCPQVIITTMWWMVLKCYDKLPIYMTFALGVVAIAATGGVLVLLPCQVEICDSSQKFIASRKAANHTFNRYHKNRYYYLRWNAQGMLPVRFGLQFILSKRSPIGYLNVLMTNLTNAVLLINP